MVVDVILAAGDVKAEWVEGKNVAVIDVFRATSVIVEALRNGARAVVPAVSIDEAWELADKYGRDNVLLGGERNTVKIEGFDKDNSPRAYTPDEVAGKTIVFTTTNGTRAIRNSAAAEHIYVASLLNISGVCRALAEDGKDIVLVCSGRSDRFTAEDGLCAGAMVGELALNYGCDMTDIAEVMQHMYAAAATDLARRLGTTTHYNDIMKRGYDADVSFCLQRNIYDIVPEYHKTGEITL